jgi:hypothetical protein
MLNALPMPVAQEPKTSSPAGASQSIVSTHLHWEGSCELCCPANACMHCADIVSFPHLVASASRAAISCSSSSAKQPTTGCRHPGACTHCQQQQQQQQTADVKFGGFVKSAKAMVSHSTQKMSECRRCRSLIRLKNAVPYRVLRVKAGAAKRVPRTLLSACQAVNLVQLTTAKRCSLLRLLPAAWRAGPSHTVDKQHTPCTPAQTIKLKSQ